MSTWVDGVLLSVVHSALLTGIVIINSLLGHESVYKEFPKFGGVFIWWRVYLTERVACLFDGTSGVFI